MNIEVSSMLNNDLLQLLNYPITHHLPNSFASQPLCGIQHRRVAKPPRESFIYFLKNPKIPLSTLTLPLLRIKIASGIKCPIFEVI